MPITVESLAHTAHELVMLPFSLFTFLVFELPKRVVAYVLDTVYALAQLPITWFFKPSLPPKKLKKPRGRIAVIGAGLTGISSAAHAVAHGFDVVIYEKSDKVGGIWTSVNKSAGLQLNSFLYRFHPGLIWKHFFPHRDEILGEIGRVWKEYRLEERTRFGTTVNSVRRASLSSEDASKWTVNDGADGNFDAVIVNIGTCGEPNMVMFPGMPGFKPKESDEHSAESTPEEKKVKADDGNRPSSKRLTKKAGAWALGADEGDSKAIRRDQEEKKIQGFPKPEEVYGPGGDNLESPTQDITSPRASNLSLPSTLGKVNGSTTTVAGGEGPWSAVEEDTWEIGKDQVQKKEQGFPRPDEAYEIGEDPQANTHGLNKDNNAEASEKASNASGSGDSKTHNDLFTKPIVHSSQLTSSDVDFKGKRVVILGGGASAVESVETALAQGAAEVVMVTRDDKWIIPRNAIIDTLIASQPFGREMPLSFLWEWFIGWYNYHGVKDLIPTGIGLFEGTPIVNDDFLNHVRAGRCKYVRGDIEKLTPRGVKLNVRSRGTKPGDDGDKHEFDADVVVLATGFKKPDVGFLPDDLFPEGYDRPNLYLQNFSTEDWSILVTNSAYMNAIGTVGHFHIGIYARILLTFLMDPDARPSKKDMKLWVDVVRFVKRGARGGAFGFFTYMELTIWLLLFHLFRPDRIKWMFFIMQGWGVRPLA